MGKTNLPARANRTPRARATERYALDRLRDSPLDLSRTRFAHRQGTQGTQGTENANHSKSNPSSVEGTNCESRGTA